MHEQFPNIQHRFSQDVVADNIYEIKGKSNFDGEEHVRITIAYIKFNGVCINRTRN